MLLFCLLQLLGLDKVLQLKKHSRAVLPQQAPSKKKQNNPRNMRIQKAINESNNQKQQSMHQTKTIVEKQSMNQINNNKNQQSNQ
jgi:hypothetical protein